MSTDRDELQLFVGLDPGGRKSFGVAILAGNSKSLRPVFTGTGCCVEKICEFIGQQAAKFQSPIGGVGIDAPMSWPLKGGYRPQDEAVWVRCPGAKKSVLQVNSLRGAVIAQGPAAAIQLRKQYGDLLVSEVHPAGTVDALGGNQTATVFATLLSRKVKWLFGLPGFCQNAVGLVKVEDNHQFDALVAAYAVYMGCTSQPGWNDLMKALGTQDQIMPVPGAVYFFPR